MEVTEQLQSNLFFFCPLTGTEIKTLALINVLEMPDKTVHDVESFSPIEGKSATIKYLAC